MFRNAVFTLGCFAALVLPATAQVIQLDFSSDTDGTLSAAERAIFQSAADTLNGFIIGYEDGITQTSLTIDADDSLATDGTGGVLASAGPTGAIFQAGYWIANGGIMEFDPSDVDAMMTAAMGATGWDNPLFHTVVHEILHTIGFGTLWGPTLNNVYDPATGEYTGAFGLDAYRNEFDQLSATFVPVEMDGDGGTAGGHWDEDFTEPAGPHNLTGVVDQYGRDLGNELMTGWTGPGGLETQWLSETTMLSLQDIGFRIEYTAIPEASLLVLLQLAALAAFARRRR